MNWDKIEILEKPIIYYILSTVLKNGEPLKRKKKRTQLDGNIFFKEKTSRHYNNFCMPL